VIECKNARWKPEIIVTTLRNTIIAGISTGCLFEP